VTLVGHTMLHGKCRLPGTTGTGLFRPTHRFKPHKHSHTNALSAFNEAAEFAAGGHVDVATAEGLLHALPVDPDAVWTHLQHHSIGLSSVAGFFDTLQTTLHGTASATSLPSSLSRRQGTQTQTCDNNFRH
jgi:hypothetical protein